MPADRLPFDDTLRARMATNLATVERVAVAARDGVRRAAVAIVIVGDADGRACFLLTRRAATLKRHAGQWALPGGGIDAGETPQAASLRELHEEIGLSLDPSDIVGMLDDYPTRSGFVITPVVVWGSAEPVLDPDPSEVESVHLVPVELLEEEPVFLDGPEPERPIIRVPLYGRFVHAPTGAVLHQMHEVALRGRATRVAHYDQPSFAWG